MRHAPQGAADEILAECSEISTKIAYRVAKACDSSHREVLTGETVPQGTCRHCGMLVDG